MSLLRLEEKEFNTLAKGRTLQEIKQIIKDSLNRADSLEELQNISWNAMRIFFTIEERKELRKQGKKLPY